MTSFQDGPAKGKVLALRSSPKFLRVVVSSRGMDALDQPEDTVAKDEVPYVYELVECLGTSHVIRGGGKGGFYSIASYKFYCPQPKREFTLSNANWKEWCKTR